MAGPIAERLADEGFVALAARSQDQLKEVVETIITAGGHCLSVPTDVTNVEAIESMVARAEERLGPVDLLINNAGRFSASGPIWEMDANLWWSAVAGRII